MQRKSLVNRFWERVEKCPITECWLWTGATIPNGYGSFYKWRDKHNKPVQELAHRWSYRFFNKKTIPPKYEIDHLCRVKNCVNPAHLEAVTRLVNMRRSFPFRKNMKKTHCINNHALSIDNLYFYKTGNRVDRKCRQCARDYTKARYAAKRFRNPAPAGRDETTP